MILSPRELRRFIRLANGTLNKSNTRVPIQIQVIGFATTSLDLCELLQGVIDGDQKAIATAMILLTP